MTIKHYADTAIEQGKLATEQANQFVGNLAGRAAGAVGELRAQAERALPIDSIKSVVEPYLEQARKHMQKYGSTVSDRAEGVVGSVRQSANNDPRIAKALATAETVAATVQERVVKPVADRTGLGNRVSKPTTAANRKPANTRPATKKATAKAKPGGEEDHNHQVGQHCVDRNRVRRNCVDRYWRRPEPLRPARPRARAPRRAPARSRPAEPADIPRFPPLVHRG